MKTTKYLLIGGGLAAHSAIKGIRQHDPEGSTTLVGEEAHLPYDRPPLSKYYMRGEVPIDKVYLSPPAFYVQSGVETILGMRVERLDATGKTATLASGQRIQYEKALVATGGRPIRPDIPGADRKGVYCLRMLDDATAIAAEATQGRRAVIIGGGFIGIELCASLSQRGVKVTVIDTGRHIWARFADETLAGFFQRYCTARGVTFVNADRVQEIRGQERVSSVVTKSGKEIPCDFVCVAVGIVPNVELAQQAGLQADNGVVVDESLRTSAPDVFAAGDIMNYFDPHSGKRRRVEHWGLAEYAGTLAGENMAGAGRKFDLLTYVWSDIFDLHLEFAGDEQEADRKLVRGRIGEGPFSVLYLKRDVMTAHFSVNVEKKAYRKLQKLIGQRVNLAGRESQLQDASFDVAVLLAQGSPAAQ